MKILYFDLFISQLHNKRQMDSVNHNKNKYKIHLKWKKKGALDCLWFSLI